MNILDKGIPVWSYIKRTLNSEPYEDTPLEECSDDQIRELIEFHENNIFLNKVESDELEFVSVKLYPQIFYTRIIDISWMPLDFIEENPNKFQRSAAGMLKNLKRRMTSLKTVGSLYGVVKTLTLSKMLTTERLVGILEKTIVTVEVDFNNYYINTLNKNYQKMKENLYDVETEIQRTQQYDKSYRSNIVAAFDKKTKRLPVDNYTKFIKQYLMSCETMLTELHLNMTNAINDEKYFKNKLENMKINYNSTSGTDVMQGILINNSLKRETEQMKINNKTLKQVKHTVRQDYLNRKYKLERSDYKLYIQLADKEINEIKNSLSHNEIITANIDNELLKKNFESKKRISEYKIKSHMEVQNIMFKTNESIKTMEWELKRNKERIQFFSMVFA